MTLNYTKLLPPALQRKKYVMHAVYNSVSGLLQSRDSILIRVEDQHGEQVGDLYAAVNRRAAAVHKLTSAVTHNNIGRGIGKAMYVALFHIACAHGLKRVIGGVHSTTAHHLWLSLNEQYDLGYAAEPRQSRKIARAGRWDERWGKYHASLAKFCALHR